MIPQSKQLPVQLNDKSIELVSTVTQLPCLTGFAPESQQFLRTLSGKLLKDPIYKPYPELLALGFWLRASNLRRLEKGFFASLPSSKALFVKPVGTVLHICPGNVDTMFAYSWACSLLVGNNNIVRTPTAITEAQQLLLDIIAELFLLPEFSDLAQRNIIASWSQESDVSARLSQQVQARMIWGGDETIAAIRKLPTLPGCRDLAFADKFSVALLSLDELEEQQLYSLAELLWRDINTFQQAACSSPKVLLFCSTKEEQKLKLYKRLSALANHTVCLPATSVNHLVAKQLLLSQHPQNQVIYSTGLTVVKLQQLDHNAIMWHPAENFLYEYNTKNLQEALMLLPVNCQTVSHYGFSQETLQQALLTHQLSSPDRMVPVGQALNFSEYWDGYELLKQLSRVIELVV